MEKDGAFKKILSEPISLMNIFLGHLVEKDKCYKVRETDEILSSYTEKISYYEESECLL